MPENFEKVKIVDISRLGFRKVRKMRVTIIVA